MMNAWKDVTSDEIQEVIDHLETVNCIAHAKIRYALFDVLADKLREEEGKKPEVLLFHIKCPQCTRDLATLLVNDSVKIWQQAVTCTCGWHGEKKEVVDFEFPEDN